MSYNAGLIHLHRRWSIPVVRLRRMNCLLLEMEMLSGWNERHNNESDFSESVSDCLKSTEHDSRVEHIKHTTIHLFNLVS